MSYTNMQFYHLNRNLTLHGKSEKNDCSAKKPFMAYTHNTRNQCFVGSMVPENLAYGHNQL